MNWRAWIRVLLVLNLPALAHAADIDSSVSAYAVRVNDGAGVYLGGGLVLSVAHIVGGDLATDVHDGSLDN